MSEMYIKASKTFLKLGIFTFLFAVLEMICFGFGLGNRIITALGTVILICTSIHDFMQCRKYKKLAAEMQNEENMFLRR